LGQLGQPLPAHVHAGGGEALMLAIQR